MTYIKYMEFIETPRFSSILYDYLDDDSYLDLQICLIERPDRGDIIRGGGGIRKLRFAAQGKGKSGGVRVIYYWVTEAGQIYLLTIYPKSRKDTLTDAEVAELRAFVKEICHG
jgi:hypothetical protein